MAVVGDLVVNLSTDARKFSSGLDQAKSGLDKFQGMIAGATAAVTNFGIQMAVSAAKGVASLGMQMVSLAADAEVTRIQFEVLTGSLEKGTKLFKDIEKFAARTSFDLASAGDAAKNLLATGVGEADVIATMQLLGDLAMGDANKLGFIGKAYTDVLSKGKLQAQELRQFAENGVGLLAALSTTLGKSTTEVQEMASAGEISFSMMQEALLSLTGEGGRFNGMMERINGTMTGQWNSLIEQIQTIGRDLGALILPTLTAIVSETNKFLQAFMQVEDKSKFIGELLQAGVDVGIETILEHWDEMLGKMLIKAAEAGGKFAKYLDPAAAIGSLVGGAAANAVGARMGEQGKSPLDAAKDRFAGVMGQLAAVAPKPEAIPRLQVKPAPEDGAKLAGLFGSLVDAAGPIVDGVKSKIGQTLGSVATDLDFWGNLGAKAIGIGGDPIEKKPAQEMKFAGAMQKGSAEAFSTVIAAMFGGKNDPNVKATEKQTKELVKAFKQKPVNVFNLLEGILT